MLRRYEFLICVSLVAVFIFLAPNAVIAGAGQNVSGFAWSENIGWVSFNSSNCDPDNNGLSNGGAGCPASGTAISNYGVNIDASGILSGYAWSENIGWISFNRSDTGAPPASPDYGTYLAKVDLNNKEVSGWARVLANGGGWDGWVKFRGLNYGVWLDESVNPVEFRNWSWSDMVFGWMSFNCADRGTCGTSNYKVITGFTFNQPPQATGSAIEYQNYCNVFAGQGQIGFRWTYQDSDNDNEIRFDFRVNDINDVNNANPEIDRSYSGLSNPSGTVNTQSSLVKSPLEADKLEFGKTYYWWVKVYDNRGKDSGWIAGPSFATPLHAYPWPDFDWTPVNPRVEERVTFSDRTTFYVGGAKTFVWTFQDGTPGNSSNQNPAVTFSSAGQKQITLQATDGEGYSCSVSKTLNTQLPVPDWREIIPFSKVWDFFMEIPQKAQVFFSNFFNRIDLSYLVR